MDRILKGKEIDPAILASLRCWVEGQRRSDSLAFTVATMVHMLESDIAVTVTDESDSGFANYETATVVRIIENSQALMRHAKEYRDAAKVAESPVGAFAARLQKWWEGMSVMGRNRTDVGSLWRVKWTEVALHLMAE